MAPDVDPTNPQPIDVAEETLSFRHPEFSSGETLLMSAFSLLIAPPYLTIQLQSNKNAPLPPPPKAGISVFGNSFSSESFSAQYFHPAKGGTIQVSCYALFKGWLLLSQPPCCIGNKTAFST